MLEINTKLSKYEIFSLWAFTKVKLESALNGDNLNNVLYLIQNLKQSFFQKSPFFNAKKLFKHFNIS